MPSSLAQPRPSAGASSLSRRAELPTYQPMAFAMTENGQRSLSALKRKYPLEGIDQHLDKAIDVLSEDVAELNDNYSALAQPLASRRERLARMSDPSQEEQESIDKLQQELDDMKKRVEGLTTRMEEKVRQMIDSQQAIADMTSTLTELSSAPDPGQTQPDDDDDEPSNTMASFTPTDPAGGTQRRAPQGFRTRFSAALEQKRDRYTSLTPAQRYASHKKYYTFKRLMHDAQNPDGPPLGHESTWFSAPAAAAAPGETARPDPDADSDDDLQETRATISTKCPLTLREFLAPVTSAKCPHSFESEAIAALIAQSKLRLLPDGQVVDGAPRGRRTAADARGEQCVRCPVPGCNCTLTQRDLAPDPVLVRRIARLQRAARQEEDEEVPGRRRDGRSLVEVSSRAGTPWEGERRMKAERLTRGLSEESEASREL